MSTAVGEAPVRPSRVKKIAPLVVAAVAMAFVVWRVPFHELLSTLGQIRPGIVALAFLTYMFSTLIWSMRWRALLGLADVKMTVGAAWRVTLEAQAGGVLLPGGIGGDALRIAYARERAPGASLPKIVASIFMDRVIGLVTLASLSVGVGMAFNREELGPALYFVGSIPIASAIGFAILRVPRFARASIFSKGIAARVVQPMLEYAADPRGMAVLGRSFFFSLIVSALQLLVVRLFVLAFDATPSHEGWVYVGTTLGMMVAALPATPGAWGTADAAYVLFLGRAGIAAPVAAAVCLLYRVSWYASAILGALLTLSRRNK